jgi:DedD protein
MNPESESKQQLQQRLIGAVVVTALAAIFLPMLFDDPVDNSGQQVSELAIPKPPGNLDNNTLKAMPENMGQVLVPNDSDTASATTTEEGGTLANGDTVQSTEPTIIDEPVGTEIIEDTEQRTHTKESKQQSSSESLDTGTVDDVEKPRAAIPDDVEDDTPHKPKHVEKEHNMSTMAAEPKIKKSTKNTPANTHKTLAADNDDVEPVAPKTKPATVKGLSRWSIQAGSFSKKENAMAMLEKLQKQGFPVTMQTKGDIYRLKIGPELDKNRAADMKKRLDKQNIQSLMITE